METYLDEGVSGSATSRPALDQMLADAHMGKFSHLLVWKLDRLGRSLQHLLQVLEQLEAANISFVSARDPGLSMGGSGQKLMFSLLGAFSEFERNLIRERVVAGIRRAQADGVHCGRPKVELDLRPALAMIREGHGLRTISKAMGVSRATLRRRLREAGEWPRPHEPED
jgi:DNA invertase Pin-like site-specific DNA recombinase